MTSCFLSDLRFRDEVAVHPDVARVFSFSFLLFATMRNEFPVFIGQVLLETPLLGLPGVLRCAERT